MAKKSTKTRPALFERLKAGLEEGVEFAKGKVELRTIDVPDSPPDVTADDVIRIREGVAVSQAVFAKLLNVSTKTVQSWEQGVRRPSQSALRLLQIVDENPEALLAVVQRPSRNGGSQRQGRSTRKKVDAR